MRFPKLEAAQASREMLAVFRGYNASSRIGEDEFSDMENLTADHYPLLSPRGTRGVYAWPDAAQGLIAKDSLCWVDGSRFVLNGYGVEMGLSKRPEDCPKRLVSMGAYVIIFPDKKYINTLDVTDFGNLEAEVFCQRVVFTPCMADGTPLNPAYIQPEEPESPENMALWLDSSASVLMQWSAGSGMWVPVEGTCVKLSAPNIGKAFRVGDGVWLDGMPAGISSNAVIRLIDDDYLVVPGLLEHETECTGVRISRKLPAMDYVIECGNRLWGCRYGVNADGAVVNEIYASKLGDFRNWYCFDGVSTDSYMVSLGADGPFTGAIQHMGYPVFFREGCLHKIYGSYPANFRLQTTPCRGVQFGSGGSLAIVGEVLYYKSSHGVCAYDGALPVEVGQALGMTMYHGAVAGSHRGKYYISMADRDEHYHLFVLDTVRGLWHREDNTRVTAFCDCRDEMYFLDEAGRIMAVGGSGMPEEDHHWMAQTGDIGVEMPTGKYLAKLTLRLWLEKDAEMRIFIRYDEEPHWQPVAVLRGRPMGSVTLPLRVRRCDHLRLKLEGSGDMRLYSLTKTIEQGSDAF